MVKGKRLGTTMELKEAAQPAAPTPEPPAPPSDPVQRKIYDLEETLKQTETRLSDANRDIFEKNQQVNQARSLINDLLSVCPTCKARLMTLDWNSHLYILTCGNGLCREYRKPLKNLNKADVAYWLNPPIGG